MVIKIAISGKMCSGKSFCSNMIAEKYPQFKTFSFADKLKKTAHELFFQDYKIKEGGEHTLVQMYKNRRLYVDFGQRMREIEPNVWINHVLKDTNGVQFALIDDLRFKNEMKALKINGWKTVRLNVSRELQIERLKNTYNNYHHHLSNIDSLPEVDLDDVDEAEYDLVLHQHDNNVDIDYLLNWVGDIVEKENSANVEHDSDICCNADCSDCNNVNKMNYVEAGGVGGGGDGDEEEDEEDVPAIFVDFEKYIKDNGVIC
jgi:hypothetical protein